MRYLILWWMFDMEPEARSCVQYQYAFSSALTLQLMVSLGLLQMADQLPRRHKDPASLLAAGKWIPATELVHIIDTA